MYDNRRGLRGLGLSWGDVGSAIGDAAGWVWGNVQDVLPSGEVVEQTVRDALETIRHGTIQQAAAVLQQNLPPDVRRELEAAYAERRARELAGGAVSWAPLLLAGGLALYLFTRR